MLAIAPLAADASTFDSMPVNNPIACGCHGKDKHPKPPKSDVRLCKDCCKECSIDQEFCGKCPIDHDENDLNENDNKEHRFLLSGCDNNPEACKECLVTMMHRMDEEKSLITDNYSQEGLNDIFNIMGRFPNTDQQAGYFTSHPGAVHWLVLPGLIENDKVQLEDFSMWKVKSDETYLISSWSTFDQIVIYANYWWRWNNYPYIIENVDKGTKVQANIHKFLDPMFDHTIFHHWIFRKDDYNKIIWLEDGTRWIIHGCDYNSHWHEGQTIIMGINTGISRNEMPNILINANLPGNYVRACCSQ